MLSGVSSWKNCCPWCYSSSPRSSFSYRCCFSCSSPSICLPLPCPLRLLLPCPLRHLFPCPFRHLLPRPLCHLSLLRLLLHPLLPLCPFLPLLLLRLILSHPLRHFWGIREIFLFQTFSMLFSYCYFFQTLMNVPLHHPFVT